MGKSCKPQPLMIFIVIITILAGITRHWVYFALSVLYVVIYAFNYSAFEGETTSQKLLSIGFGPNMDVPNMTRRELLKSGRSLLLYALVIPLVVLPISWFLKMENVFIMAVFWGISIIFLMCLGGGLYLVVRGLFRSKKYIPVAERDQISSLTLETVGSDLFEQLEKLDTDRLFDYQKNLFEELKVILSNIDPNKIDERSYIKIVPRRRDYCLEICIEPKDNKIFGIHLSAEIGQLVLGYAGSEQIYVHNTKDDSDVIIREISKAFVAYLGGVSVIESLNKKGKVIKREYYFNAVDESNELIKVSTEFLSLFSKGVTENKYSYRFLK